MVKRFGLNNKIKVFNFGLGKINIETEISKSKDASSLFNKKLNHEKEKVKIIDIEEFIKEEKIKFIDILKINIEGGEYDLIEKILQTGLINKIHNLQIQFHNFVPDAKIRMENIQNELSKTHFLTYQYNFVWENWELKK